MWNNFLLKAHAYTVSVPIAKECKIVDGVEECAPKIEYSSFNEYFLDLVNYAVNLAFALAVLVIVFGALKYVSASGDDAKAKEGKDIIVGALVGLALLLLIKLIIPLLGVELPNA